MRPHAVVSQGRHYEAGGGLAHERTTEYGIECRCGWTVVRGRAVDAREAYRDHKRDARGHAPTRSDVAPHISSAWPQAFIAMPPNQDAWWNDGHGPTP